MAFKTFSVGDVLTAADVNDYLMEQAVIACTSATRPASPNEGMTIFETDTDLLQIYNGTAWVPAARLGAWTDYSGSLSWTATGTNPAIGNGAIVARYMQVGKRVLYSGRIEMGSTTTFGTGTWSVSLPVTALAPSAVLLGAGAAHVFDSGTTSLSAACRTATSTTADFATHLGAINATNPITWATGDVLRWTIEYEAA